MASTSRSHPTLPQHPEDNADYGYYNDDSDVDCDFMECVEEITRYNSPTSFYPIRIGDVLNQTYRIDHKLGHGGFSTVWMAFDLKTKKNVAVKVLCSMVSGEHELTVQKDILCNVEDTSHLVLLKDTFLIRGKGRDHRVFVYPLCGPTLGSISARWLSMATRMSAAKQLLEALEGLHKAGFVHRDLNDRNVMWGVSLPGNLSKSERYKIFGRPCKMPIPDAWRKGDRVIPTTIPKNFRTETFYLGDFGLAMRVGDSPIPKGYPPLEVCSPERLHGVEPTFSCDIWSYTCLFAQLWLSCSPFIGGWNNGLLGCVVDRLGPLPRQLKGLFTPAEQAVDQWYNGKPNPAVSLESLIKFAQPEASPSEQKHVLAVLSRGFALIPAHRPTATQLLQDPDFKAIMELYA
ncbi:hypothetical protein PRK78_007188 [Emydomyces testavorans]|uniref:Protein kinase domain-containing protein n=1 Tax=Emydomyces testavorans TaxID=2070801 RepID=A0AAF0DMS6_9EURO|nr:hypothetical protein PRK78_007188 [Emydomyces testavorans]